MSLFGPSYSQIPGLGEDLQAFSNFDPRANMLSAGKYGNLLGGMFGDIKKGKLDQNAYFNNAYRAPIQAQFAGQQQAIDRGVSMNPFLIQHPELQGAIKADKQRQNAQDMGNSVAGGLGNFLQGSGQGYQNALDAKYRNTLGFNALGLNALEDRAKARQGGTTQTQGVGNSLLGFLGSGLGGLV